MADIKLSFAGQQPTLFIGNEGNLQLVTGVEAVDQQLRLRLKFFLGEHFLDERQGIPFYREVFVKNPNLRLLRTIFSTAIRTTPGVSSLDFIDVSVDSASRTLNITFSATTDTGETLTYDPFILEL